MTIDPELTSDAVESESGESAQITDLAPQTDFSPARPSGSENASSTRQNPSTRRKMKRLLSIWQRPNRSATSSHRPIWRRISTCRV